MTIEERTRLETQTKAWLGAMRIAWVKRYGVERGECPVPTYEAMSPADRSILLIAMAAANRAGTDANMKRIAEAHAS